MLVPLHFSADMGEDDGEQHRARGVGELHGQVGLQHEAHALGERGLDAGADLLLGDLARGDGYAHAAVDRREAGDLETGRGVQERDDHGTVAVEEGTDGGGDLVAEEHAARVGVADGEGGRGIGADERAAVDVDRGRPCGAEGVVELDADDELL